MKSKNDDDSVEGLRIAMQVLILVLLTMNAGCHNQSDCSNGRPIEMLRPRAVDIDSPNASVVLDSLQGKMIEVRGECGDAKAGPIIAGKATGIYILGIDRWPSDMVGKTIRATGRVSKKVNAPEHVDARGVPVDAGIWGTIYYLSEVRVFDQP